MHVIDLLWLHVPLYILVPDTTMPTLLQRGGETRMDFDITTLEMLPAEEEEGLMDCQPTCGWTCFFTCASTS